MNLTSLVDEDSGFTSRTHARFEAVEEVSLGQLGLTIDDLCADEENRVSIVKQVGDTASFLCVYYVYNGLLQSRLIMIMVLKHFSSTFFRHC